MTLDFSRCPRTPFAHQREDVAWLIERPYALIASEMRTGKSKICVDAAQFMFEARVIDKVVVIAPAPVRDVWADKVLGQIAAHSWIDTTFSVVEYHASLKQWTRGDITKEYSHLQWLVTNFEFIRSKNRLIQLLPFCGPKTLLIIDEGSYVKNYAAQQTKACMQIRKACGRVVILNGTPIFASPLDLFSQGNMLSPTILACPYVTHFKSRYAKEEAVLGYGGKAITSPHGRAIQKIVGWHEEGLKDLQRRFAPYTVRRLQKDCLDLPDKLDPVTLTATMDDQEWHAYSEMKSEMVVWLKSGDVAVSSTAAIKALRLSQITGGFLGGVEGANIEEQFDNSELVDALDLHGQVEDAVDLAMQMGIQIAPERLAVLKRTDVQFENEQHNAKVGTLASQEIGRSKLDVLLWFLGQQLDADPLFHVVTWFRFRPELLRAIEAVRSAFPQFVTGALHGGNKKAERREAMMLLHPDSSPKDRPVFVGGIEGTGSFGTNFTAAHTSIDYSSGYSPGRYLQKTDRIYGPGMSAPCAYYDIVAVGPKGQRTIDHAVIAARRARQDVASWTSEAWVKALTEE